MTPAQLARVLDAGARRADTTCCDARLALADVLRVMAREAEQIDRETR